MHSYPDLQVKGDDSLKAKVKEGSATEEIEMAIKMSELSKEQYNILIPIVAEKFITVGYGYQPTLKSIKKRGLRSINHSVYTCLITTITLKTFRALENFLIENCKQKTIKRISRLECQVIRSPIVQAVKWLREEDLNTLYKFIIRTFNLQNKKVYISQNQATHLYAQIIQTRRKSHEIWHIILNAGQRKQDGVNVRESVKLSYVTSDFVVKNLS